MSAFQWSPPDVRPSFADNYFFAAQPDTDAGDRLVKLGHRLKDKHRLTGRVFGRPRLHVSLLPIHPGQLNLAHVAAAEVSAPAFSAMFDQALSFARNTRNHPFVLTGGDPSNFEILRDALFAAAMDLDMSIRRSSFTPHMTLLYDEKCVSQEPIERIDWPVCEFVLIHSYIGRHRYEILGRWPLATS